MSIKDNHHSEVNIRLCEFHVTCKKTNYIHMKKVTAFLLMVVFASAIFTSCKSHETCPAYGKKTNSEYSDKI